MPFPVASPPVTNSGSYLFGEFRCDSQDRVLYRGDEPVPLPPKAALTLVLLLRNAPRLVGKDELLKEVWPDTFVEEGNLAHHISLLRKTLGSNGNGKGYIETVPRRGYRFAGDLQSSPAQGEDKPSVEQAEVIAQPVVPSRDRRWFEVTALSVLLVVLVSVVWWQRPVAPKRPPTPWNGTSNAAAYKEFLNGRLLYTSHDPESLRRAIAAFERAVELDPGYAAAYGSLAEAYYVQGEHESSDSAYDRMRKAATTALALDPNLPQANAILGFGEGMTRWRWKEGEELLRRALQADPNYTHAHILLSIMLNRQGKTAPALQEAQQVLATEPFHSVLPWLFANIYYYDRRYDQATEWIQKGKAAGTNFGWLSELGALILAEQDKCGPALQSVPTVLPNTREQIGSYGYVLARCGQTAKALALKRWLRAMNNVDGATTSYFVAMIDIGLRRDADALRDLELAYEGRSGYLARIKADPIFDRLRHEPRFSHLLTAMNLGEQKDP